MAEKIPINEFGEGNCCPECGSLKVSIIYQFVHQVEFDLKSGKEIYKDTNGNRIYKPSTRHLATLYECSKHESNMWLYKCRKCGWISKAFTE